MKKNFISTVVFGIAIIFSSTVFAGGAIVGVANFVGENPGYPDIQLNKDPEVCGTGSRPTEKLILSAENKIKNVYVTFSCFVSRRL